MKNEKTTTAYTEREARHYDEIRFQSSSGKMIHELERGQLERSVAMLASGDRVLEIGAGTARFSIELAERGFDVTALDPSLHMIEQGRNKVGQRPNPTFVVAPGEATGLDSNSFDLVFSTRVLNRLGTKELANAVLKEKFRLVRPGGLVSIDIATTGFPLKRPGNPVLYSFAEVINMGEANGFELVSRRGMFIFSSHFIHRLPDALLPLWKPIEHVAGRFLYGLCSKGTVIMQKRLNMPDA